MYPIQHYVIKFVSDLRQVGGFLRILDITEILLKVVLNTINQIKPTYIVFIRRCQKASMTTAKFCKKSRNKRRSNRF